MKKDNPRKRYIEAAAQIIQEQGIEAVSARKVAAATQTVGSALYKHFKNVEELIVYASLRYQEDSYEALNLIADQPGTALDMYLKTERFFAQFAFSNPTLFNNLMFGTYSSHIAEISRDYYEMFPSRRPEKWRYTTAIISGSTFEEGNLRLLSMCMADGSLSIPEQELDTLNDTLVNLFNGFLKTMIERPETPSNQLVDQYVRCFEFILEKYRRES